MSYQILEATVSETTVAAADTELDDLCTAAADLVATESGIRMVCKGSMVVEQSSVPKTYGLDCDLYEDDEAAMKLLIAQYTGALTAIEGASGYTDVTNVKVRVKFTVWE